MAEEKERRTDAGRASSTAERSRGATALSEEPQIVADEDVRRRAYELYERRGGEQGHDWDDWFRAEQEVRSAARREDEPA